MPIDDLVSRAKAGDPAAFAALYDRHAGPLYRYALARLGEPAEAEDVLQRVFLDVIEALPRYEDRGLPFGAWLFRIARNAVIDAARARRPVNSLEAVGGPTADERQWRFAEQAADRAEISSALGALTSEQREVILYRFFARLSHEEIGRLMGKQTGTVRALQFRALHALRRLLSEPESESHRSGQSTTADRDR